MNNEEYTEAQESSDDKGGDSGPFAEDRAEAYKPAVDRIAEAKAQPRTDGVIIPADTTGPVNIWPILVHPTGNRVEELVYDPSTAGVPGDEGYEDPKTVIADLPKGSYKKDDGKYYRMKDEMKNELEVSNSMSQGAYDRIQGEFKAKHGREMDHEVAVIRARLESGEIDREGAKNLAYALRYKRDVDLAKRTALEYWKDHPEEMAGKADNPYAMAEIGWKNFYVDTSRIGIEVAKGRRAELLDQMNREAKADPASVLARNLTLAKRFGFDAKVDETPVYEVNPEANLSKNYRRFSSGYWAAARRTAQSVIDEVNAKGSAASGNDLARRANAMRAIERDSRLRDADVNDFNGLDPLVPAKHRKGTRRTVTGQYTDPQSGDRLTRMLTRYPSTIDDLVSLYMED